MVFSYLDKGVYCSYIPDFFFNLLQVQLSKSTIVSPVTLMGVNGHGLVRDVFIALALDWADHIFLKLNVVVSMSAQWWTLEHTASLYHAQVRGAGIDAGREGNHFLLYSLATKSHFLHSHQAGLRISYSLWRGHPNSSLLRAGATCFILFPKVTQAASRKAS